MGRLIIVTAPSGAGKTTIVRHLLGKYPQLAFSVSATTRARRENEVDGKDYYFITPGEFRKRIAEGAFLEWEEVYEDQYYGTLKSEAERLWAEGKHILFDIEVHGATNLRKVFPEKTLAIFVKPPSPEVLAERLRSRRSESEESLQKRIEKSTYELTFEKNFDIVLVNDILENALAEAEKIVEGFIVPKIKNENSQDDSKG